MIDNTLTASLSLLSAFGGSIINAGNKYKPERKPLIIKSSNRRFIICSFLALLCPIAGFIAYNYLDWWLSVTLLVFGTLEFIIYLFIDSFPSELINEYYFEESNLENQVNHSHKVLKGGLGVNIILAMLNTYYIFKVFDFNIEDDEGVALILTFIKIAMNIMAAYNFYNSLKSFHTIVDNKKIQLHRRSKNKM